MWLGFVSYVFVAFVLIIILAQYFFSVCGFFQQDISLSHPIWFELIKGIPAAFVTLGIGVLATYVAWHQYKVAKAKLKFDLFEKRLEIYNATSDFLLQILKPNLNLSDLNSFSIKVDKSNFLFGDDVQKYLNVVSENASKLWSIHLRARANQGMILHQDIEEHTKLANWSTEQRLGGLRIVFEKYLSFETWH